MVFDGFGIRSTARPQLVAVVKESVCEEADALTHLAVKTNEFFGYGTLLKELFEAIKHLIQ